MSSHLLIKSHCDLVAVEAYILIIKEEWRGNRAKQGINTFEVPAKKGAFYLDQNLLNPWLRPEHNEPHSFHCNNSHLLHYICSTSWGQMSWRVLETKRQYQLPSNRQYWPNYLGSLWFRTRTLRIVWSRALHVVSQPQGTDRQVRGLLQKTQTASSLQTTQLAIVGKRIQKRWKQINDLMGFSNLTRPKLIDDKML